jgi:hypothetical protein
MSTGLWPSLDPMEDSLHDPCGPPSKLSALISLKFNMLSLWTVCDITFPMPIDEVQTANVQPDFFLPGCPNRTRNSADLVLANTPSNDVQLLLQARFRARRRTAHASIYCLVPAKRDLHEVHEIRMRLQREV